ncbi:MAG TPA: L-lactate permease [Candidatus Acidoferrales bacterium]|nr:L-lactate permease [Candidatus Acidoferrales bacterium]
MTFAFALIWPQPLDPLHSMALSALVAVVPLAIVLILMGGLRRSGLLSTACGLLSAGALAVLVWHMPFVLAFWSTVYGVIYALWSIMWIVFAALWLYNLAVETGKFDQLRRWMTQRASGDPCIQAILVAFCFGALLEGTAGFGTPVAMTAFLLVGMGFKPRRAIVVSLIADTAPVAFGALGIPIVALAGVTGLNLMKLSSMVGRQLPFISFILPGYLVCVVAGRKGLRRTWPAVIVAGFTFALAQFLVSNFWGPWAADIIAALASIAALIAFLHVWRPAPQVVNGSRQDTALAPEGSPSAIAPATADSVPLTAREAFTAWLPWILLSAVMVLWSYFKLFELGQITFAIPHLHNAILITLYGKLYAARYAFQPLATGTAVLVATILTALCLRARPKAFAQAGAKTLRQLRVPGLTVVIIVALAYLYNYSGMAYTLGAALARVGEFFPFVSSYLGWVACFLSGSDTASNLLFGNLQVAAAHQLHLNPVLLAATNSSGGVTGKMISPQNIAVGVTTVGLIGEEGKVLRSMFWHSIIFASTVSILAFLQAHWLSWMVP